jgi:hypothetical protein
VAKFHEKAEIEEDKKEKRFVWEKETDVPVLLAIFICYILYR